MAMQLGRPERRKRSRSLSSSPIMAWRLWSPVSGSRSDEAAANAFSRRRAWEMKAPAESMKASYRARSGGRPSNAFSIKARASSCIFLCRVARLRRAG